MEQTVKWRDPVMNIYANFPENRDKSGRADEKGVLMV